MKTAKPYPVNDIVETFATNLVVNGGRDHTKFADIVEGEFAKYKTDMWNCMEDIIHASCDWIKRAYKDVPPACAVHPDIIWDNFGNVDNLSYGVGIMDDVPVLRINIGQFDEVEIELTVDDLFPHGRPSTVVERNDKSIPPIWPDVTLTVGDVAKGGYVSPSVCDKITLFSNWAAGVGSGRHVHSFDFASDLCHRNDIIINGLAALTAESVTGKNVTGWDTAMVYAALTGRYDNAGEFCGGAVFRLLDDDDKRFSVLTNDVIDSETKYYRYYAWPGANPEDTPTIEDVDEHIVIVVRKVMNKMVVDREIDLTLLALTDGDKIRTAARAFLGGASQDAIDLNTGDYMCQCVKDGGKFVSRIIVKAQEFISAVER